MEGGVTCPYCTFVNAVGRYRCAMCLKMIRKRDRSQTSDASVVKGDTSSVSGAVSGASDAACRTEPLGSMTDARIAAGATPIRFRPPFAALNGATLSQPAAVEERADKQATPYISSLFATAAGVPVLISEALLQQARLKFSQVTTESSEGGDREGCTPTASVHQDEPHSGAPQARGDGGGGRGGRVGDRAATVDEQRRSLPDETTTAAEDGGVGDEVATAPCAPVAPEQSTAGQVLMASALLSQSNVRCAHRRGFVPPQRTAVGDQPHVARQQLGCAAAGRPPAGRTLGTTPQFMPPPRLPSSKAGVVSFDYTRYTSRGNAAVPPIESLVSGQFAFAKEDLSVAFCELLQLGNADISIEVRHWWRMLQRLGASNSALCTTAWCATILIPTLLQVRELQLRVSSARAARAIFSPTTVALCLCAKFNSEAVFGQRPALRRLVEGDVPAASLMVLQFISVCEERGAPHTRVVCLSDGYYCLKAAFDVPLSNLLRERVIFPGQKIAVCGAKSLLHGQYSPTECSERVVLGVNYNCVRAVTEDTPLGLCLTEPAPLSIHLVHPLGGLVPAMQGVVARVLPPFFVTTEVENEKGAGEQTGGVARRPVRGGTKVVRNLHAQIQYSDGAVSDAAKVTNPVTSGTSKGQKCRDNMACVTSILLISEGAEALVQQWRSDASGEMVAPVEEEDLPAEGSTIVIYALNPSRFQTATAPFTHAKLFYSARNLHFVLKQPCTSYRRVVIESIGSAGELPFGGVVDLAGTFLGWCQTSQGSYLLINMRDDAYVLLQMPLPEKGRILSLPVPSAAGTPVLLQNCTFLCYQDPVAGSDCAKVLANEYTRLVQRPAQAYLRELMNNLATRSTQLKMLSKKYEARMCEIFRCLGEAAAVAATDLGDAATRATEGGVVVAVGGAEENAGHASHGVNAFETPLEVAGGAELNLSSPRVPYYMRHLGKGDDAIVTSRPRATGGVVLGGVPLARRSPLRQRCTAPDDALPESTSATALYHWYGNVTEIVLHECPPNGGAQGVDLLAELNQSTLEAWRAHGRCVPSDHCRLAAGRLTAVQSAASTVEIGVGWRYAAGARDTIRARSCNRVVIETILQSCMSFERLCEEVHKAHGDTNSAAQRKARLLSCPATVPTAGLWWRFCTESYIMSKNDSTSQANATSEAQCGLPWLQEEWATAAQLLRACLAHTLFKFTVRNGTNDEIVAVYCISDHCSVTNLF